MKTHRPYEIGLIIVLLMGGALGSITTYSAYKLLGDFDILYLVIPFLIPALGLFFIYKNKIHEYEVILRDLK